MAEVDTRPTLKSINGYNEIEEINMAMSHVFQEAQMTLSGHRKLVVILTNIQKKAIDLGYEEAFAYKFTKLINKILPLKKGEESGDRIIKFCSVFVANLFKIQQDKQDKLEDDDDSDEDNETTRMANYLLNHLLRGVEAKDRNVRYRIIQLIAYLVNFIGDIDAQVFTSLVHSLRKRLSDREPTVRLQAVVALSRFQHIDDEELGNSEDAKDSADLNFFNKLLIEVMQNDDSPEVRRAALLNLVKNKSTLSYLIERARDVNAINRRIVYSRILKEFGDFREIDLESRSLLVEWGLNDRDRSVKTAAIKLFNGCWFESVNKDFLQLLDNLQLHDDNENVDKLLKHLFELNLEHVRGMKFDKSYWKEFSVEKSFLLRNLFEFLNIHNYYDMIDEKFVDLIELSDILYKYLKLRKSRLTKHQTLIDNYHEFKRTVEIKDSDLQAINIEMDNLMFAADSTESQDVDNKEQVLERLKIKTQDLKQKYEQIGEERRLIMESNRAVTEEYADFRDEYNELEFIIENLLKISKDYDYADELGRRSMLQIIRTCLTNDRLSDKLADITLKVLKVLSTSERDFISMASEVITDIRDSVLDEHDETFHSAISGFLSDSSDSDSDSDSEPEQQEEEHDKPDARDQTSDYTNNLNRIENVFDNQNFNKSYSKSKSGSKRRKIQPKIPPRDILNQCLILTQHLLESINDPLSNNYSLESILQSLVYPAVLMDDNSATHKLGVKCLGLFMLLDKNLAIQKLYFFGRIVSMTAFDEEFKIIATKVIIDVLSTYGISVLDAGSNDNSTHDEFDFATVRYVDSLSINKLFIKSLRNYKMPDLQAVTAEGLCKLCLADILEGFGDNVFESEEDKEAYFEDILEVLVLSYFDAKNYYNNKLRQVLSFCIPVYAFSHIKHQIKLSKISGNVVFKFSKRQRTYEELYKDNDAALGLLSSMTVTSVIQQLIHWCDPHNLVNKENTIDVTTVESPIWQVITFLEAIEQDTNKAVKKAIISNLGKITITEHLSHRLLRRLCEAIEDTLKVFDDRSEDVEFQFDSLTTKSFHKFNEHVREVQQNAQSAVEVMDVDGEEKQDSDTEGLKDANERNEDDASAGPWDPASKQAELEGIDEFLDAEDQVSYDI
ncbi:chromosome condensation complex Condensin, subunit G [Yamadazyma tenuis]|uniref:Nuclear condensin complex subunit 3 C-terminal domain-containing protein n=1 Tax=Candida tenuis (strain ATCC 10573 / BCRC 21748 / CBS 615 / JCM 9827 / NBRC 10315 / NRRL Y-1498 / VKM Y-70) TaxID=590646 RepID=G3B517_CANTC|nr:uncharacterized protein CANTEDRAFT_93544 [Yamadazyma tenuis ATCC 10573]EGV64034.1 hypothetical protein CANTEDRAFT_93544 [Yamadazyma tenuis ATCC 10573]WEJ96340.1 chromosome condensation complex Condensin, subunit G [Yamadazyma tenuis]